MRKPRVDWDALLTDHPELHLYSERRFWRAYWRYDIDRVAAARAQAHLRKLDRAAEDALDRTLGVLLEAPSEVLRRAGERIGRGLIDLLWRATKWTRRGGRRG